MASEYFVSSLTAFVILDLSAWILVPLYCKRIKWSFIVGIVVAIIGLVGLVARPSPSPWTWYRETARDSSGRD